MPSRLRNSCQATALADVGRLCSPVAAAVSCFFLAVAIWVQWFRRRTGSSRHAIGYREIPFLGIPEPHCDGPPSLQRVHGAWGKGGVPFSPEATRGARARHVLRAVHVVQRDTHAGAVRGGIATAKAAGVRASSAASAIACDSDYDHCECYLRSLRDVPMLGRSRSRSGVDRAVWHF